MMGVAALAPAQKSPQYATMAGVPFKPIERVRMAIIGVGARGQAHVSNLMALDSVDITAVCDVVPAKVAAVQEHLKKAGRQEPAGYSKGERDFENLCRRDDIDLVYIATPWEWHVPMAVCAMINGKHAGVEVPAANAIGECWQLVNTSEKTRRHCIMLENGCYDREALMVLNMIRLGVLGEIKHGEGAYIHDLRRQLTADASEGLWRRFPHTKENGNLYPTHGLGRVANYMGINRGDRFDYLVSMSSPEFSLSEYVRANAPQDSPKRKEKYICGDMNTSLIKTALGRTIVLQHDVVSPRPSDRVNLVSGTKGTFRGYPARLFLDGQKKNDWQTLDEFAEQYEHPLWKEQGDAARKQGRNGGRDFAMCYQLTLCMQQGMAPGMDVYDAAALSAPKQLSEASVAHGSLPQKFPDFTRGKWKDRKPQFPFALA
jgi:predicted dehydrogenase